MRVKIEGRLARWLIGFGYYLLQVWARTLRFEIDDRVNLIGTATTTNFIGAIWHNRLLLLPYVLKRFLPQRRGAALISPSRDGELIAMLVKHFGFDVVRGSSSSGGTRAMMQLVDVIAAGRDVVITPDGPRGPAYELGPGLIVLAQQSGAAVVPMNMEYSASWRVGSWDRFILPRPFATIRFIIGAPCKVDPTGNDKEFEDERLRLQNAMLALVEMR